MSNNNHIPPPDMGHGVQYQASAQQDGQFGYEERTRPAVELTQVSPYISRSRTYAFVVDNDGNPIELGSGRFAKAYLGEERWVQSKTAFRRNVAIKILQKGVSAEDQLRFQMEKELLERVQGHPNIVELFASGESDNPAFVPPQLRDRVESDFMLMELLDMSLEERLKGSRDRRTRDDLLSQSPAERLFRVLEYMVPIATAVEYSHLIHDVCHRDIKPANILIKLPDPRLRGSRLRVVLADFNVGKGEDPDSDVSMTRFQNVPGTLYYQSPEQEINQFELLVNVQQGSPDVEFYENFYSNIQANDTFSLWNRPEMYPIVGIDRSRRKLLLGRPWNEPTESNVRAKVTKAVGRPADIYSLGALLYYLASGAWANPKSLYEAFYKFIEYEREDENNNVAAYIEHEYRIIQNLRAPKTENAETGGIELAPEDRFFSYKHYLDGNGELIDPAVMLIVAKAMIRNKPDSYCTTWDLQTSGITQLVHDLMGLYTRFGVDPAAASALIDNDNYPIQQRSGLMSRTWSKLSGAFRKS
ncbi:serine/threonine protein kinase [Haliangium sp.]|uniref:serine/threonine protein kinase n=1 Tax=Haliangium sp. TaxID=2663208 RepID=UPI003D0DD207